MDIGVVIRNSGKLASSPGVLGMARAAEQAGADSLWVSDHVCMVEGDTSAYPYAPDHRQSWANDTDFFEALTTLAAISSITTSARLGTAALVLPQRHPIELAKQAATIDRLSGGRLELGIGAGWNRGEMESLGWAFQSRGPRMNEMIAVLRQAWAGRPGPWSGAELDVAAGVRLYPTPARPIPLLIAGANNAAIRRAAQFGDGWLGITFVSTFRPETIRGQVTMLTQLLEGDRPFRKIVKLQGQPDESAQYPGIIRELSAFGIDEVIVEIPWSQGIDAASECLLECKAVVR